MLFLLYDSEDNDTLLGNFIFFSQDDYETYLFMGLKNILTQSLKADGDLSVMETSFM